jgi:hypothetical protein
MARRRSNRAAAGLADARADPSRDLWSVSMPHAQSHFQPIAELPSEHGLTLWGYATRRDPEAVRAPGYFQTFQHHIKLGDLLLVRHTGERIGPDVAERPAPVLALYAVDRDARGTIVLHPVWRFAWAEARAAAAHPAGAPAAPAGGSSRKPRGGPARPAG